MKKLIMLVLIGLFIFPITIFAASCSDTDIVKLKTLASKAEIKLVNATYSKIMHSDDTDEDYIVEVPYLKLYINNISDDLQYQIVKDAYILWDSSRVTIENGAYTYSILDDYSKVRTLHVIIGTKKGNCNIGNIRDEEVNIPMLNPYRDLSLCNDAREFYLCQDFWYQDYSSVKINEEVNKYKNKEIDEKGKKKDNKSFLEKINEFVKKSYIYLLIVLGVILGIGVFLFIRRRIIMKKHFG